MKILVDIGHPADVHLFKNTILKLESKGHEVQITSRKKDITFDLLKEFGFSYHNIGKVQIGYINKFISLIKVDFRMYSIVKKFNPDIIIGNHSLYAAHVSKLLRKPSIIFADTEHAKISNKLTFPFATVICTPSCYKLELGPKQIQYNGYKELAYLHPNYFQPKSKVLEELGIKENECFIILRLVGWNALHDAGHKGISREMQGRFISELEKYGRVLITSENRLPVELEPYRINIKRHEKLHSLLSYARLCIADSCTVSVEAALLGTPSIHISTLASTLGVFDDLQNNYNIIYSFDDENQALTKALKLLEDKNIKKKWEKKLEKLLNEKIDVTKFITDFIERYPESFLEYKMNRSD